MCSFSVKSNRTYRTEARKKSRVEGKKKKNLCKVLRRHTGQVESLDNPELQHDHDYQQRQHPPSTTHARHSSTPHKKRKNEKTSQCKTPQLHHATKSTMQTLKTGGRKIEVETGFGVKTTRRWRRRRTTSTKRLKP